MKISQFIKTLTPSNCGIGGMHDVYITISRLAEPEDIFGFPPFEFDCTDKETGEKVNIMFKHEKNGEYRLSRLWNYIRNKNGKPGDEILFEVEKSSEYDIKFYIGLMKTSTKKNEANSKWKKYEFQF